MPNASPVLALNSGSSSLKFGLYAVGACSAEALLSGEFEVVGEAQRDAVARVAGLLQERDLPAPVAVGHRVVHGGALRHHRLIDAATFRELEAAQAFAPLHVPQALSVIRAALERFPVPHAACLDTAFHAAMPEVARVLPIPRELRAEGIERYGFHGLSCESIVARLGAELPRRVVIAHLGNGASITAVMEGRSIDTSMGFTPSGGIIMGTRCGDIDPGVLLYLLREKGFDAARLEDLVNRRSGLLGISGIDGDMRRLHRAARTSADARLAIGMFCYSARKRVAAMVAALGGIDLLVFTGGIGEHDAEVRDTIVRDLAFVMSGCPVRVMPAEEGARIARHAWNLAQGA